MRRLPCKNYIFSLFMLVMFTISVTGFCPSAHSFEPPSHMDNAQAQCPSNVSEGHCPCCPAEEHPLPGSCDSSCHCSCHAPLTPQRINIASVLQISPLVFSEPFKALPEVFLSKFVPPQNRA